jgi:bacteriorhodopsin
LARWGFDLSGAIGESFSELMGKKGASWVAMVIGLSRSILRDRNARRNFILYVIGALLVMFALGTWPLAGWLEESVIRFAFWWGGCGFLAIFLFLLGVYDFLRVMRENDPNG